MALPPGSVLDVQLMDITDRAAPVLVAQYREAAAGEVPLAFNLLYDPDSLKPEARYGLIASLGTPGGPAWRTPGAHAIVPSGRVDQASLLLVLGGGVEMNPAGMPEAGGPKAEPGNQLALPSGAR